MVLLDVLSSGFRCHTPADQEVEDTPRAPASRIASVVTAQQAFEASVAVCAADAVVRASAAHQALHQSAHRVAAAVALHGRSAAQLSADFQAGEFLDTPGIFVVHADRFVG